MSGAGRPRAVRRWLRRPLWWGGAALALASGLFVADIGAARADERTFDHGYRLSGRIVAGWDGGRDVDVTYRHPRTGAQVRANTYVWHSDLLPPRVGPVALDVSRTDPSDVRLADDRFPATVNLSNYAPWVVLPFLIWAFRRWTVARTGELMASPGLAYAMRASASPPGWWGLRWRLHLYPLDAGPAARPVCTVPLVAPPGAPGVLDVEVKGAPRPYARVVARDAGGTVLWPSGRALRDQGRPAAALTQVAPKSQTTVARWLLVVGALVFVAGFGGANVGTFADDVRDRSQTVTATVTYARARDDGLFDLEVTYQWAGHRYAGTVTEVRPLEGDVVTVRVDPASPTRVWSTRIETPPGTTDGGLAGFAILAGMGLIAAGVWLRVRARRSVYGGDAQTAWRGLAVIDGRLWHGTPGLVRARPRVRLETAGLICVGAVGSEVLYRWDDHVDGCANPPPTQQWKLQGVAPSRYNTAAVWLQTGREPSGFTRCERLAGGSWGDARWEELPALAAYLAATPGARPGLDDPARVVALVGELSTKGWRRRRPPLQPLLGDRLDLHLAVQAVIGRQVRHFGGRSVRGEPVPAVERLASEVVTRLPEWVRPRVGAALVMKSIERHLATGRWPFDVLVHGPPAADVRIEMA